MLLTHRSNLHRQRNAQCKDGLRNIRIRSHTQHPLQPPRVAHYGGLIAGVDSRKRRGTMAGQITGMFIFAKSGLKAAVGSAE